VKPSVAAFDAIVSGPFAQFLSCSSKLAGDVQTQVSVFLFHLLLFLILTEICELIMCFRYIHFSLLNVYDKICVPSIGKYDTLLSLA